VFTPSDRAHQMIEVERLDAPAAYRHLDALARVLADCVEGGASVGYLAPFSESDARHVFEEILPAVAAGSRVLLAAFDGGDLVGTAQLIDAHYPNQPHRADVAKVLVHRSARRTGVGRALMERLELEAVARGRTLLVLDTATGDAERLYERLGWTRGGAIPGYALLPDGTECDTTFFYKRLEAS
jgi:GNAT superfamily N-acetyltransferase